MATTRRGNRLIRVAPEDIRFTQENIPLYFDRPHAGEKLDEAVKLMISERLSADDFPLMRVVLVKDQVWTLNNRSLWVFRKAKVSQVLVKFQGRFDEDSSNPFVQSYLYRLMSPKDFIPQVRGECQLEFEDFIHQQSHPSIDIGVSLEVPPTFLTGDRNPPTVPSGFTNESAPLQDTDASVNPIPDPSVGPWPDVGVPRHEDEKDSTKMATTLERKSTSKFVDRSNYSRSSNEAADCKEKSSGNHGGRSAGRCSTIKHNLPRPNSGHICEGQSSEVKMVEVEVFSSEDLLSAKPESGTVPKHNWPRPNFGHTCEGQTSEVEMIEVEVFSSEDILSTKPGSGTAPKFEGGAQFPHSGNQDIMNSSLQLLASIEALLEPGKEEHHC